MERNEAIEWLKSIKETHIRGGDDLYDYQRRTAIDYAVTELETLHYCRYPEEVCCNMIFCGGKIYCNNPDGFCHLHDLPPAQTNADHIRNMSDKELARYFYGLFANYENRELSTKQWLEWLKQPADKDER